MGTFKINWDEISEFQELEKGWYEAVLETRGQPAGESRAGNPTQQIKFHIRTKDGRVVRVTRKYAVNSGAFKELVAATGYRTQGEDTFNADVLHGKAVRVWVETAENQETKRKFLDIGRAMPVGSTPQEQAAMPQPATNDAVLERLKQLTAGGSLPQG